MLEINRNTAEEFFNKVLKMRDLQNSYFRYRDPLTLKEAKQAEKEVDYMIKTHMVLSNETKSDDQHPKLF